MRTHASIGIDIGTYQVKVVVTDSKSPDPSKPKVIGTGISESKGLRHGYILNHADVVKAIKSAIAQAAKSAQIEIKNAYISIGGIGLQSITHASSVTISRADQEITELDVEKAQALCEHDIPKSFIINRKVIHPITLGYRVDGRTVLGRPHGMKGTKLEIRMLFITCLEQHVNDIVDAVNDAGIEVLDIVASPIAGSLVTLTKAQKLAGCVLANIGAETVSIVVYENALPISLEVFPIGSTDITNDIALGLRLPIEDAESIKKGLSTQATFSKRKLDEIINARLSDIFELIEAHLKRIDKSGLLPAGIIITGGGSGIATIEDLAKAYLRLPSRTATAHTNTKDGVKDSTWSVAYGLCILGGNPNEDDHPGLTLTKASAFKILSWFKQFLP